jgi:hypothetical protein
MYLIFMVNFLIVKPLLKGVRLFLNEKKIVLINFLRLGVKVNFYPFPYQV